MVKSSNLLSFYTYADNINLIYGANNAHETIPNLNNEFFLKFLSGSTKIIYLLM